MADSWIACSLRPPGTFPPGEQGAGGGGTFDSTCDGDECNPGHDCDAVPYWNCHDPATPLANCTMTMIPWQDEWGSVCTANPPTYDDGQALWYSSPAACLLADNGCGGPKGGGGPPTPGPTTKHCKGWTCNNKTKDCEGVTLFEGNECYDKVCEKGKICNDIYPKKDTCEAFCTNIVTPPPVPPAPPPSHPVCWRCPSPEPGFGTCCVMDVYADPITGKCPPFSYKTELLCNVGANCKHLCFECLGPPKWKCDPPTAKSCIFGCQYKELSDCEKHCEFEQRVGGGGEEVDPDEVAYAYNYVDPVFERNISNRKYYSGDTSFIGVGRGSLPSGLFKEKVHSSISMVYNMNNNSNLLFSDFPYTNLSNYNIERSLNDNIVDLLNEVKLATGESIKNEVLGTIRRLLISNRLYAIDADELIDYLSGIKSAQVKHPSTRGDTVGIRGSHSAEAKVIRMAGENSFPLVSEDYEGLVQQQMKLWKTLSTDLKKNIPVKLSNGTTSQLYYSVGDTIPLNSTGSLTMSPGNLQRVLRSGGDIDEIAVAGEFDRARVLQIEDLQKMCYLLGDEYSHTLNVKTAVASRIDERYGVAEKRDDYYFLNLIPDSVTDASRTSTFIANTTARYTYETNTDTIADLIKFTPWPFMVFYVDADDPILTYVTNAEEISITSKDFTFDMFEDDPQYDIYVKRIAPIVVLIPSDKDQNVANHFISRQMSYGERELKFTPNANPDKSDIWDAPYVKQEFPWPQKGVSVKTVDPNTIQYALDTTALVDLDKYTSTDPVLPRPKFGMRQLLAKLKDLKENWVLENDTVTWKEVYDSIDRSKMKDLYLESSNWNNTRHAISIGKVSSSTVVNDNYPKKITEVRSNNLRIDNPNFLSGYVTLEKKPLDNQTDTPEPIN